RQTNTREEKRVFTCGLDANEREWDWSYPDLQSNAPNSRKIFLTLEPGDHVQSCVRDLQSEPIPQQRVELFDKEVAPLGIDCSHPLDVTEEETLGDESGKGGLINWRGMLVNRVAYLGHGVDQSLGRNDVSQTQRGKPESYSLSPHK